MKNIERKREEMERYIVISRGIWDSVHLTGKQLILRKLLETQQVMGYELITLDELKAIDEIWDQELDLSRRVLVELYEKITGERLPWHDYKEPLIDN